MSWGLAILDVDGVLADVRHRLHWLQRDPVDWAQFFAAAGSDPPLAPGLALAAELAERAQVLYLTGRPERLRTTTAQWLAAAGAPPGTLVMRPDGDHRPARLFKAEQVRRLARDRDIEVIVDDDPRVVADLAAGGWPVRLADWLPYTASLHRAQEHEGQT